MSAAGDALTCRLRHLALHLLISLLAAAAFASAGAPPDPPRGDVRIAVFGDFNGSYGSLDYPPAVSRVVAAVTDVWRPDLLLSPGDVIAGQSRELPGERFAQMWAAFDEVVAAPLREAGIPYAVAMGNHDGSSLRSAAGEFLFAREREATRAYWSQPLYGANLAYSDREDFPFNYSFRFGELFVVVIDASSATLPASQLAWLEDVLASPEAQGASLRLAVGHLPLAPVSVGRDRPGEYLPESSGLPTILEQGGVDTYVSGHHAAYYPGRLGELELLFAGGVGARRLLAGDAPPRSTVTLMDVDLDTLAVTYTTFDVAGWEVVERDSLPAAITSGGLTVELSERAR